MPEEHEIEQCRRLTIARAAVLDCAYGEEKEGELDPLLIDEYTEILSDLDKSLEGLES